jgi:hypothetical protein
MSCESPDGRRAKHQDALEGPVRAPDCEIERTSGTIWSSPDHVPHPRQMFERLPAAENGTSST